MLDQGQTQTEIKSEIETYDLVVVGAGIAGLNALNASSEYLPKDANVFFSGSERRSRRHVEHCL